jgi:hypothetical protein
MDIGSHGTETSVQSITILFRRMISSTGTKEGKKKAHNSLSPLLVSIAFNSLRSHSFHFRLLIGIY